MIKTLQAAQKQERMKMKLPKSVQQAIPIQRIWQDGTFQFGSKFSQTVRFSDINYAIASKADKTQMFLGYSELLNALDTGAATKITIHNRRMNRQDFARTTLLPMQKDPLDGYRQEYNQMLLDIIDRCTANVYRYYLQVNYQGQAPTLQDFHAELLKQPEPEARDVALAMELFTDGSLNTFAKPTNVNTNARILCYDIRDLGKQLLPIGMLVVLDSIFNRIIRNRSLGKRTWIYIDEIYLLFQHEYSANFLFTLWKRVRKYGACCTGITQNVADLLQSHTARTMLANSEFLVMLNQAPTDRVELARLLNISDDQLSYITDVEVGHGLLKCGSTLVPFEDNFPRNTQLYKLMSTKPSDQEL